MRGRKRVTEHRSLKRWSKLLLHSVITFTTPNVSQLALGNVISALGDKMKRGGQVPYHDSLLQDSFGGYIFYMYIYIYIYIYI